MISTPFNGCIKWLFKRYCLRLATVPVETMLLKKSSLLPTYVYQQSCITWLWLFFSSIRTVFRQMHYITTSSTHVSGSTKEAETY